MRNLLFFLCISLFSCSNETSVGVIQNSLNEQVILRVYTNEDGQVLEENLLFSPFESLQFVEVKTGSGRSDFKPTLSLYNYLEIGIPDSISLVFDDQRVLTFVEDGKNRPLNIFYFTPLPDGARLYEQPDKDRRVATFIIREEHKDLSF